MTAITVRATDSQKAMEELIRRLGPDALILSTTRVGGMVEVPKKPGLGIALDMTKVEAAYQLYMKHGLGSRDDAQAMQYLIPGWKFDNKRPCMVR